MKFVINGVFFVVFLGLMSCILFLVVNGLYFFSDDVIELILLNFNREVI